jgi:hypothetical protein
LAAGAAAGTISVVVNAVREALPFPAAGALTLNRYYYVSGDGLADAATLGGQGDLIAMLQAALAAHSQAPVPVLTQDGAGFVSFGAGTAITIEGAHVDTTVDLTIWGLDNLGDHILGPGSTPAPYKHRRGWYPGQYQAGDSRERGRIVGGVARPVQGQPRAVALPLGPRERQLSWEVLDPHLIRTDDAAANAPWSAFETTWEEAVIPGYPLRFYQETATRTGSSFNTYSLAEFPRDGWPWIVSSQSREFYDVSMLLVRRTS